MRKCSLDLAPEAPWNCPSDCPKFERRLADVNWRHGTLVTPPTPDAPPSVGDDPSVAALLDSAEDIINNVGSQIREEVEAEMAAGSQSRWRKIWPFRRR
jgi:hypothetical protein